MIMIYLTGENQPVLEVSLAFVLDDSNRSNCRRLSGAALLTLPTV